MKIYRSRRYPRGSHPAKKLLAYGAATLIIGTIFFIWGVTLLANLSTFWDTIRGSTKSAPTQTTIAPPPPHLNALPLETNNPKVNISGSSTAGATITLYKNGTSMGDQLVGNDGQFNYTNLRLTEGSNAFTAYAKDNSGNKSAVSNSVTVILDTIPPSLTLDQPTDGENVTSQFLTVSGSTDPQGIVTVNGQQQIIGSDGKFSGQITLQSGSNTITVIATDQADNITKVTRTVTYTPASGTSQ